MIARSLSATASDGGGYAEASTTDWQTAHDEARTARLLEHEDDGGPKQELCGESIFRISANKSREVITRSKEAEGSEGSSVLDAQAVSDVQAVLDAHPRL